MVACSRNATKSRGIRFLATQQEAQGQVLDGVKSTVPRSGQDAEKAQKGHVRPGPIEDVDEDMKRGEKKNALTTTTTPERAALRSEKDNPCPGVAVSGKSMDLPMIDATKSRSMLRRRKRKQLSPTLLSKEKKQSVCRYGFEATRRAGLAAGTKATAEQVQ